MSASVSASPHVSAGAVKFGNDLPISIIAGPCQLESRAHGLEVASALKEIAARLKIGLVYKTSFDKANRTSASAARGIGLAQALPIFAEIRSSVGLPVLTDVHEAAQCAEVAQAVDVLQIPAFLCRQTDLLLAAAATGKVVNVKKGQFLAPWDMANVVAKITGAGNSNVLVTERGASFGYNTLVSDMRALPILARTTGAPVIFDATHSVQQPGGKGTSSGGEREFVPVLARAAVAVGVAGVFIETHPDPDHAPSDGPNMVPLRDFEGLLRTLMAFDAVAKKLTITKERDALMPQTACGRMIACRPRSTSSRWPHLQRAFRCVRSIRFCRMLPMISASRIATAAEFLCGVCLHVCRGSAGAGCGADLFGKVRLMIACLVILGLGKHSRRDDHVLSAAVRHPNSRRHRLRRRVSGRAQPDQRSRRAGETPGRDRAHAGGFDDRQSSGRIVLGRDRRFSRLARRAGDARASGGRGVRGRRRPAFAARR